MRGVAASVNARARRALPREARQEVIAAFVLAHGAATVAELVEHAGVSTMTVHRDLDELARRGVVRKFHGGASAQPSTVFESSSEYRARVHTDRKKEIAARAVQLVEPGMSVLVDDSTTGLALVHLLCEIEALTVITNFYPAIEALRKARNVHLIAIGGDYSPTHDSFLGIQAKESIEALAVDLAFITTGSMTSEMTYQQDQQIVYLKRAMLQASRRAVLLMDSSKLGRTALHRVGPVSEYDLAIFDETADPEFVREVEKGVSVQLAGKLKAT